MKHVLMDVDGHHLTQQEAEDILSALIEKLNLDITGFGADKKRAEMDRRVRAAWTAVELDFRARSIRF